MPALLALLRKNLPHIQLHGQTVTLRLLILLEHVQVNAHVGESFLNLRVVHTQHLHTLLLIVIKNVKQEFPDCEHECINIVLIDPWILQLLLNTQLIHTRQNWYDIRGRHRVLVHHLVEEGQDNLAQILRMIHTLRPVLPESLGIVSRAGHVIRRYIVKDFLRRFGAPRHINNVAQGILIQLSFDFLLEERGVGALVLFPRFWKHLYSFFVKLTESNAVFHKRNLSRPPPRHILIVNKSDADGVPAIDPAPEELLEDTDAVGTHIQEIRSFRADIEQILLISAIKSKYLHQHPLFDIFNADIRTNKCSDNAAVGVAIAAQRRHLPHDFCIKTAQGGVTHARILY